MEPSIGIEINNLKPQWEYLTFVIFANFDVKRTTKITYDGVQPRSNMSNISFSMGFFPIKNSRNAQWLHLFSMGFDGFSTIYLIF